jgi:hypothetical protein
MTFRLTDKDHGYAARVKLVERLAKNPVDIVVGILASVGGRMDGKSTVLDVAIDNEFGVRSDAGGWRIPPRSFIRAWFDEHKAEGFQKLAGLMRRVAQGKLTEEQAYNQFGLWCVGSIQARIAGRIAPPNAASTIRAKGSSTPLVNTGQLRSSIASAARKR